MLWLVSLIFWEVVDIAGVRAGTAASAARAILTAVWASRVRCDSGAGEMLLPLGRISIGGRGLEGIVIGEGFSEGRVIEGVEDRVEAGVVALGGCSIEG